MSRSFSRRAALLVLVGGSSTALAANTAATRKVFVPIARKVSGTAGHPTPGTCLTAAEADMGARVNAARAANGLPAVPLSTSLCTVAQWHVIDLFTNRPDTGTDPRGQPCNMHSWSNKGAWSPVCYTADHHYAEGMWSKPREISAGAYSANGYENAYGGPGDDPQIAAHAVAAWLADPPHADVILERGIWAGSNWQAMGVGAYNGYAALWFGQLADPLGAIHACG